MNNLYKDISKIKPKTQKKLTILGYFILLSVGVPIIYWIAYLLITPWVWVVEQIMRLF